jgi:hypothetical protein
MAYDRRLADLTGKIRETAPDPNDPVGRALTDCAKRYADLRAAAFGDLICLVNDAVIGATDLQSKWVSRVNRARAELDSNFGDSVKDLKLSQAQQTFWLAAVQAERVFFEKLSAVRTAQTIEDLLKHQGVLARMIDDLQVNWKDVLSADESLQGEQLKPVKEVDALVQELINKIEAENRAIIAEATVRFKEAAAKAAERLREGVREKIGPKATEAVESAVKLAYAFLKDQLKDFVGVPREVEPEIEIEEAKLKSYIERLAYFAQAYRERCATYRSLMSIEKGGVLTMFKNTRKQVADYEKSNNLTTAQIMRDEAKRFLNDWAGSLLAEQRDDAAEFNAKIFEVIDKNWKVTEEMHKQFQSRFAGIFTAPLTSDTLETLTESYLFRQAIDGVNSRGAAPKIDDARRQLEAAPAAVTDDASRILADMSLDWPDELKEAAKMSNENFRKYVRDRLKSQMDTAIQYLGELRILLDPPKLTAEWSREELDAMLRS